MKQSIFCRPKFGAMLSIGLLGLSTILTSNAYANGLGENRSWQFDSSADKANKAVVADMIEKKRSGYYDGFVTNVYTTTNIGTQINCNNIADATGNIAENVQGGSSASASPSSALNADSTGNDNESSFEDSGSSGESSNNQGNEGSIISGVDGSSSSSGVSDVSVGSSAQDLVNGQDNSGAQNAEISESTACFLEGSTITGNVDSDGPVGAIN